MVLHPSDLEILNFCYFAKIFCHNSEIPLCLIEEIVLKNSPDGGMLCSSSSAQGKGKTEVMRMMVSSQVSGQIQVYSHFKQPDKSTFRNN